MGLAALPSLPLPTRHSGIGQFGREVRIAALPDLEIENWPRNGKEGSTKTQSRQGMPMPA